MKTAAAFKFYDGLHFFFIHQHRKILLIIFSFFKIYILFVDIFTWPIMDIGNVYILFSLNMDNKTKTNSNRYTICTMGMKKKIRHARAQHKSDLCELTYNLTKRDDIKRLTKPKLDHFFQWSRWNLIAAASSLLLLMPPPTITIHQSLYVHVYIIQFQCNTVWS